MVTTSVSIAQLLLLLRIMDFFRPASAFDNGGGRAMVMGDTVHVIIAALRSSCYIFGEAHYLLSSTAPLSLPIN